MQTKKTIQVLSMTDLATVSGGDLDVGPVTLIGDYGSPQYGDGGSVCYSEPNGGSACFDYEFSENNWP